MTYHFWRAVGISSALYITSFIVGLLSVFVAGEDMSSMQTVSDSMWYIGMVLSVILAALFTLWYFQSRVAPSAMSGLLFGLTAVILSIGLDVLLFTLGNTQGANTDLWVYYGDYRFWVITALVLATTTIVGYLKQPQTRTAKSRS